MNREIKFRGKKIDSDDWMYGYLREVWGETQRKFVIAPAKSFECDGYTDTEEDYVKEETISQFTGRTDKNGKEIYEGDILKAGYYDTLHEVVFSDTVGAFMLDEIPSTGDMVVIGYEHIVSHFEVIGNIHDNKELMEE